MGCCLISHCHLQVRPGNCSDKSNIKPICVQNYSTKCLLCVIRETKKQNESLYFSQISFKRIPLFSGHPYSGENKDMENYFRQASVNLKEILKNPGVWDPFILSYVEVGTHSQQTYVINGVNFKITRCVNNANFIYIAQDHISRWALQSVQY